MKQQVIDYFRSDRSFAEGARLYSRMPGKSMAFERQLNNRGDAPGMRDQLHYELARLAGIPEQAMQGYLSGKLAAKAPAPKSDSQKEGTKSNSDDPEVVAIEELLEKDDYHAMGDKIHELELETESRQKKHYRAVLKEYIAKKEKAAVVAAIPEKARQAVKLREEFPFLKEKDCPEEFKIMVADRMTAYQEYVAAHKKLHQKLSEAEIAQATEDVVENFLENRLIYKELEHYRDKGEPLGEHPIWGQRQALEEIQKLGVKELINKKNSLSKGISTDKKKIQDSQQAENPDEAKIEKWQKALAEKEFLLLEVDKIMDRIDNK